MYTFLFLFVFDVTNELLLLEQEKDSVKKRGRTADIKQDVKRWWRKAEDVRVDGEELCFASHLDATQLQREETLRILDDTCKRFQFIL